VWFFIFMSGKKERKKMNRFFRKSKLIFLFTVDYCLVDLGGDLV